MSEDALPKPAATLVLLRPNATGFSVLLMKRPSRSSFMAGMHVFPGGKLEAGDRPAAPSPAGTALAPRMGLAPLDTAAYLTAAARETHEEMGLQLAEHTFVYFDHWVTPVVEPKRFDTRFFAAAVPAAAEPKANEEAISWGFFTPQEALDRIEAGDMAMAPPTLVTMMRLVRYKTLDEALAGLAARSVAPLQPEFAGAEPLTLALPGHEKHPVKERLADNPLAIELSLEGRWKIYW